MIMYTGHFHKIRQISSRKYREILDAYIWLIGKYNGLKTLDEGETIIYQQVGTLKAMQWGHRILNKQVTNLPGNWQKKLINSCQLTVLENFLTYMVNLQILNKLNHCTSQVDILQITAFIGDTTKDTISSSSPFSFKGLN